MIQLDSPSAAVNCPSTFRVPRRTHERAAEHAERGPGSDGDPRRIPSLTKLDTRIPSWDRTHLRPRVCPFCSSSGEGFAVRPDGLTVKKCSVCDCRFVAPAPSADELARFYTSYYTGHVSLAQGEFAGKSQCSCPRHDYRLDELRSLTDWSGKAVLDVGCGMGELLEACQRQLHMEIAGVDLDPDAVRRANERLQTQRILQGGIERFLGKSRFDLIIMHDLIEHPLDPLSLLEQASQLLAPSGCLLLWTPNGAFADPAAPAYTTFRVNLEHMQYLTARTIRFVLDKLPLSIVHLETCGYPALAGIDQPPGGRLTFRSAAKQLARRLVGDRLAQRLRDAWVDWRRPSIRLGSYHLFAILQKDPEP